MLLAGNDAFVTETGGCLSQRLGPVAIQLLETLFFRGLSLGEQKLDIFLGLQKV